MSGLRTARLLGAFGVLPTASQAGVAEKGREQVQIWLTGAADHTPALLIGLIFLVVVPVLAVAGLLMRWVASGKGAAGNGIDHEPGPITARIIERARRRPQTAWLELEGRPTLRYRLDHELVRIGREDDNDIRIEGRDMHRYHAVVQRGEDADLVITDVSSPDGNGVVVNGRRLRRASLVDGDRVELGGTVLVFRAAPVFS